VEGGPVLGRVIVPHVGASPLLCVVGMAVPPFVRLRHGSGWYASMLRPGDRGVVRITGTALRWGRQSVGPVSVRLTACDGLLATRRSALPPAPLTVFPRGELFDSDEPLPRAAGVAGVHRSRRPGQDGELSGVRPFQAGDRLRRVNWRVTSRSRTVHVNATLSERDADVVLVLDVRHEVGASGGVAGPASVLDTAVRAAAAIAGHYTVQGDRVGLVELGPRLRRLRPGTGRRHHQSIMEWLVDVDRWPTGLVPGVQLFSAGLRPPGALLIVLTPLLDRDSAGLLAGLARAGRPLVAVDTLPTGIRRVAESPWSAAGERLWRLERVNTIGRLREVGVPLEAWQGAGSLDLVLRHAYRLATRVRS
jgi:uncharacterized protein (DUF58 family)